MSEEGDKERAATERNARVAARTAASAEVSHRVGVDRARVVERLRLRRLGNQCDGCTGRLGARRGRDGWRSVVGAEAHFQTGGGGKCGGAVARNRVHACG